MVELLKRHQIILAYPFKSMYFPDMSLVLFFISLITIHHHFMVKKNPAVFKRLFLFFSRCVRRMKLVDANMITLDSTDDPWHSTITLDIKIKRVYWLNYNTASKGSSVISSDYDGKVQKHIVFIETSNTNFLGASDNSIFVIKNDEARILVINETEKILSRSFAVENSDYYDIIVLNNNFNHASGK